MVLHVFKPFALLPDFWYKNEDDIYFSILISGLESIQKNLASLKALENSKRVKIN